MHGATRERSTHRLRRNPILAIGTIVLIVLLLCWPFVREPPLDLRETYIHLFGAWSTAILVSWWWSRGLAQSERSDVGREQR